MGNNKGTSQVQAVLSVNVYVFCVNNYLFSFWLMITSTIYLYALNDYREYKKIIIYI